MSVSRSRGLPVLLGEKLLLVDGRGGISGLEGQIAARDCGGGSRGAPEGR